MLSLHQDLWHSTTKILVLPERGSNERSLFIRIPSFMLDKKSMKRPAWRRSSELPLYTNTPSSYWACPSFHLPPHRKPTLLWTAIQCRAAKSSVELKQHLFPIRRAKCYPTPTPTIRLPLPFRHPSNLLREQMQKACQDCVFRERLVMLCLAAR